MNFTLQRQRSGADTVRGDKHTSSLSSEAATSDASWFFLWRVWHRDPIWSSNLRASDFPFQKNQFSVSKKVKFRFDSVSLFATLNSMKSQYIERKYGERAVKMVQLVR